MIKMVVHETPFLPTKILSMRKFEYHFQSKYFHRIKEDKYFFDSEDIKVIFIWSRKRKLVAMNIMK